MKKKHHLRISVSLFIVVLFVITTYIFTTRSTSLRSSITFYTDFFKSQPVILHDDNQSPITNNSFQNPNDAADSSSQSTLQLPNIASQSAIQPTADTNQSIGDNDVIVAADDVGDFPSCDLYNGSWVRDVDYHPIYEPGSCPFVDEAFDCQNNGRRDSSYLKWRWKPNDCDLPR